MEIIAGPDHVRLHPVISRLDAVPDQDIAALERFGNVLG